MFKKVHFITSTYIFYLARHTLHKTIKKIVFKVGVFDGNVTRLKMNNSCLAIENYT